MRAPSSPARRLPTGCRPRTSASRWDGRGRFLANIFIERLWRSLKYEAVYLHELRSGLDAERIIWTWVDFYDDVRPHSPLVGRTPNEVIAASSVSFRDASAALALSPARQADCSSGRKALPRSVG